MAIDRRSRRHSLVSDDARPEPVISETRRRARTVRYRRHPSAHVKLVLRHLAGADLAAIARCVDRVLARQRHPGLADLIHLSDRAWAHDPDARGGSADRPFVDAKTLNARKQALKRGEPTGLPFRLRPVFSSGLKRRPKTALALFEIDFAVLTLPIRWTAFSRRACKPNGTLFDLGYALVRACKEIIQASPVLHHPIGLQSLDTLFPKRDPMPPEAEPGNWHIDNIAPDGFPTPRPTGRGVTIGHPDTGYTEHSQLNFDANGQSPNYRSDLQFNLLPDEEGNPPAEPTAPADAREPIVSAAVPGRNHYHGTRTASVMISDDTGRIDGVAPGALVAPIRCVRDVVILAPEIDDDLLADAIVLAVERGCQVISISLGGYPCSVVQYAIQYAVANDVIVVGAAGNYWPLTVFPAGYPECVGVGGSTADDLRWQYSGRNYKGLTPIQISAPSEFVRQAAWKLDGEETSKRDFGTSFGTAIVAGAAALWLERHGRDRLIQALGGRTNLAALFIAHLGATARTPADWDTALDGPGILNLSALLDPVTMPDPATFSLAPGLAHFMKLLGPDPAGEFQRMHIDPVTGAVSGWMTGLFGAGADALALAGAFGEELMTLVMTDPLTAGVVGAVEDAVDAAEDAADAGADAVAEAAEVVADAVSDTVETVAQGASDTLSEAAGWFGF